MIDLNNRTTWPAIGSRWKHSSGRIYEVMLYANVENDPKRDRYPVTIVYFNVSNRAVYCRRLDDWARSFIPGLESWPDERS